MESSSEYFLLSACQETLDYDLEGKAWAYVIGQKLDYCYACFLRDSDDVKSCAYEFVDNTYIKLSIFSDDNCVNPLDYDDFALSDITCSNSDFEASVDTVDPQDPPDGLLTTVFFVSSCEDEYAVVRFASYYYCKVVTDLMVFLLKFSRLWASDIMLRHA